MSGLLLLVSCLSSSEWMYRYASAPNRENAQFDLYDLYQDEQGQKGIVVFNDVDPSTWEGSVFIMSLDEGEDTWGPQDKEVYPITYSGLESLVWYPGYTLDINQMVHYLGRDTYPAFKWCLDKNPEGEPIHGGSWILPGIYEWYNALKDLDLDRLNSAFVSHGGVPLSGGNGYYWTASEDQEGALSFGGGNPDNELNLDYDPRERAVMISSELRCANNKIYWSKSLRYRIRAVKYIYCYEPYSKDK